MNMKKYEFSTPGLFPGVTAEQAVKELERIREKRGVLTPEVVVEESRDEKSVLHKCFQWDDAKAAALYRVEQARTLIANIRVEIIETVLTGKFRGFVNVTTVTGRPRSFIPLQEAMLAETPRADLLAQAKRDAKAFVDKYSQLEELNKVKQDMLLFTNDINE